MKKLLTFAMIVIMAAISCEKLEEDGPVAVLESYDADSMTLTFTVTLTEDDISAGAKIGLSVSRKGDPYTLYLDYYNKEKLTYIIPREEEVYWAYFMSEPVSKVEKVGRNTYQIVAYGFHPGNKYYVRLYVRMSNDQSKDEGPEIIWSNLIEKEMPRPGEPYITFMEFSNVGSTSADANVEWASNGQHWTQSGYIISTSKSEVEKEEGLSVEVSNGNYHLTGLLPSTTYYVRFWNLLYNPILSSDLWMDGMFYSPDVYSFTTLAK